MFWEISWFISHIFYDVSWCEGVGGCLGGDGAVLTELKQQQQTGSLRLVGKVCRKATKPGKTRLFTEEC